MSHPPISLHGPALLLVAVALVGAACAGGDATPDTVASLDNVSTSSPVTTLARLETDEALLVFSRCMRDNGVELPDVAIGPGGAPLVDQEVLDSIDFASDEFQAGFRECVPILAAAGAFQQTNDPEELARQRDELVVFAQCMREEGFEDFPDPNPAGQIPFPLSVLADFGDPVFDAAIEVCQQGLAFDGAAD